MTHDYSISSVVCLVWIGNWNLAVMLPPQSTMYHALAYKNQKLKGPNHEIRVLAYRLYDVHVVWLITQKRNIKTV